ncbi:hypothetical protein GCM10010916_25730 [Paenibacillus abyssi]|uniref:Uncharacterized protein n=1 Tax=Paenibacillus abyssi TaxID=1340531 RepID=A0A917FVU6_9BACL|nr:hypothetical protein GCM10010916_25730 [Paenibacillus abyssi]
MTSPKVGYKSRIEDHERISEEAQSNYDLLKYLAPLSIIIFLTSLYFQNKIPLGLTTLSIINLLIFLVHFFFLSVYLNKFKKHMHEASFWKKELNRYEEAAKTDK